MRSSDSIVNLAPALVAAQAELQPVVKDRVNTHFKNEYATLDAIIDAVRPVLAKHGLAVVQGATRPHTTEGGTVVAFEVVSTLIHKSGEWLESSAIMPLAKYDPQGAGSAQTYGRRYSIASLLSLATETDDDGESAVAPRAAAPAQRPAPAPAPRPAPAAPAAAGPQRASDSVRKVMEDAGYEQEPNCPKCQGPMWDNRQGKKNPKAPDYKCKDKACDGVVWPPKTGAAPRNVANAAPRQSQPDFDEPLPEYPGEDDLPF